MGKRIKELSEQAVVADGHNHPVTEVPKWRKRGETAVFRNCCASFIRQGGVRVLILAVGRDTALLANNAGWRLYGNLSNLDILNAEPEESSDALALCLSSKDIDAALKSGKIVLLLGLEGNC